MTATPSVVIHGHFYQPPREDPWLDELETEPSAAPFHDWNERIERECYRAVVAARSYAPDGRIAGVVNTLESISFDVGPTLLEWMERYAQGTYAAILSADAASRARNGGHGNAIAMPYHHVILPLASRRDKETEVRWGIMDFRRRFRREPVGMWLPETAVDAETLDVLATHGVRFTVLAPHQVSGAPPSGLPGRYRTPGGRTIALFAYDGAISHDVAFGNLLRNAERWAERVLAPGESGAGREVVSIATDGETYGHHHHFGEVALAWLLGELPRRGARVENFASILARRPPEHDVTLVEPSSWSCPHGVDRWRADCGCRLAPERATNQRWRTPLRDGLDWLAGEIHAVFAREAGDYFDDPWAARDAFGEGPASTERPVRARELLELERNALRMFTSCGWFFDDIAGIEAQQVLRYAARAIELSGASARRLEDGLLDWLAKAESNDAAVGTGRDLYLSSIKPRVRAPWRVAAGYSALRDVSPAERPLTNGYLVRSSGGRLVVTHTRTGREYTCGVRVERSGAARLALHVAPTDGEALTLTIADVPEFERRAIIAAIRSDILKRHLTHEESTQLATGAVDFAHVAARALTRAVSALERDQSPAAVSAVTDLADLLALHGLHIPFDAQTELFRVRAKVPKEVRTRLGFAEGV